MPKAHVNGIEISFERHGVGAPLLFIHGGFGGPASTLVPGPGPIAEDMPSDYELITFDRRCAGLSEYTLDWFDLTDIAADARALLAHLGIDRSIVVGSSMGGMVALQYIESFPEAVTGLALMNTGADLMSETDWGQRLAHQVDRHKAEGDEAVYADYRDRLRSPPEPNPPKEASTTAIERMRASRAALAAKLDATSDEDLCRFHAGTVRNAGAFLGHDFSDVLADIDVPTLVVHGNADDVVPYAYGQALAQGIAGAEFHTVEAAGHGILAYPEARAALHAWLARL